MKRIKNTNIASLHSYIKSFSYNNGIIDNINHNLHCPSDMIISSIKLSDITFMSWSDLRLYEISF